MNELDLDSRVLAEIPRGKDNARKSREIALRLGLHAPMSEWDCPLIRQSVRRLREHHLIASGPYGYYKPVTEDEIKSGRHNIVSRIRGLAETLNLYDRSAADLTRQFLGQLRLLD